MKIIDNLISTFEIPISFTLGIYDLIVYLCFEWNDSIFYSCDLSFFTLNGTVVVGVVVVNGWPFAAAAAVAKPFVAIEWWSTVNAFVVDIDVATVNPGGGGNEFVLLLAVVVVDDVDDDEDDEVVVDDWLPPVLLATLLLLLLLLIDCDELCVLSSPNIVDISPCINAHGTELPINGHFSPLGQ